MREDSREAPPTEILISIARGVVDQLARGDYQALVQRCPKSRLTSEDLRIVIEEYGRKLVSPPRDAGHNLDVVKVVAASVPTWSVRVPLWTEEEGLSDLTLELAVTIGPDGPETELDDLHVL